MGKFWLFQAVPQRFNFDGFLIGKPSECEWLATRHFSEMRVGDGVLLWRGKGIDPNRAGAVGWARIASLPVEKADTSPGRTYWVDPSDAEVVERRVRLHELETRRRPLYYDDLKSDPLLSGMSVFRMPQASNFRLKQTEVARMMELWLH